MRFSDTRKEYRRHISALLPLWGFLYLIAAPVQWVLPHFLLIGLLEISIGYLVRTVFSVLYTVWAVRHLSELTIARAIGVFALSWFTLPVLFLLISINPG